MVRVVLEAGVDDAVVGGDETVFVATVKVHTVPKEMKLCSLPQYRYTIPRQLKLFSKRHGSTGCLYLFSLLEVLLPYESVCSSVDWLVSRYVREFPLPKLLSKHLFSTHT